MSRVKWEGVCSWSGFRGIQMRMNLLCFFCFVLEGGEGVWLVSLVLVIWSTFKTRQEVSILMQPSAMEFEKNSVFKKFLFCIFPFYF